MMDEVYIKARLGDVRFAVPAADVLEILPEPVTISLPDAPEGVCGIVYDKGAVRSIRALSPACRRPARLVVLCACGAGTAAYAADRVETMAPLDSAEREDARPFENTGILLLDKEGRA